MIVYRIEHPLDGIGPYKTRYTDMLGPPETEDVKVITRKINSLSAKLAEAHDNADHPTPWQDGIEMKDELKLACRSLVELHNWFFGWIHKLRAVGFRVYEIEVKPYSYEQGGKQIAFHPNGIVSKKEIPFSRLIKAVD